MYKRILYNPYHPERSKIDIIDSCDELIQSLISIKSEDFKELSTKQKDYLYRLLGEIFKCKNVLVCKAIHAPTNTREIDMMEELFELVIKNVELAGSRNLVILGNLCIDAHKSKIFLDCVSYDDELSLDSTLAREIGRVERLYYIDEALKNL